MANGKDLVKINWDKAESLIKEKGFTNKQCSLVLGMNENWVSNGKAKKSRVSIDDLTRLAILLGVNPDDLLIKDTTVPLNSESGKQIAVRLAALEDKVDELIDLFLSYSDRSSDERSPEKDDADELKIYENFAKKPAAERAKIVLTALIEEGGGKCLHSEFIKRLTVHGIASSYAKDAIKACGYVKGTTGYGNNTTTWILSEH